MVRIDNKDEMLRREVLLFEPYQFKSHSHGRGNASKAIAEKIKSFCNMKFQS